MKVKSPFKFWIKRK